MKSQVYFADLKTTFTKNLSRKIAHLLEKSGISQVVCKNDLVSIKLHFGEKGNTAFIRPVFIRKIVESIKAVGGFPFLTDANTLYAGTRSDSPHHLTTATQNGFACPIIQPQQHLPS
jgi:uncharacterized Fe-S center protein